jgi:hypothetical protein
METEYIDLQTVLNQLKPGETLVVLQKNEENENYTLQIGDKRGCKRIEDLTKEELLTFYAGDYQYIRTMILLPAERISLKTLINNNILAK